MKKIFLPAVAFLCICFASCKESGNESGGSAFNLDSAKAAIAASNKVYGECFAKKDSVAFVACYTKDACILVPNAPKMCGNDAIKGFFNYAISTGVGGIDIVTEELTGNADGLSEVGTYNLKDAGGKSLEKGKFIVLWKQEDGKWKMHRDIFNGDAPPPPPAKK